MSQRPRARSEATRPNTNWDALSPTRRVASVDDPGTQDSNAGIQRRSSAASRAGSAPRSSPAARTQGNSTLTGPDETPQMRLAHEPFVQPGYGDLNPAYEQPANAKPLWSLAKPLPRVVRSGMVPTKGELLENRANAQLPAENSQRMGLDVDLNDFEPPLTDSTFPEDLHPLVQELVEDEAHNNHTTWSVIRTHHREALAEFLAAFVQLTIGFCADLSVTIANQGNPNTTSWAWGFATMMAIYISGGISGAHLNPAVTSMLWFYRGFPKRKMPEYFLAQFLGAFCAGLVAYGLYYRSIQQYLLTTNNTPTGIITSFVSSPRESWIDSATAFWNEFLGTTFLSITILALGDDQNAPPGAGMNSLIIGLVITCLCMTLGYQTGGAFSPSRDFGPRLALLVLGYDGSSLFTNPYWFYGPWAGAVSGSFVGAFLYDFFIFTGGESPVNYPLKRTQRAMRVSRMRWERRLHLDGGRGVAL